MSAVVLEREAPAPVERGPQRKPRRRWTRFLLPTYTFAFILYLCFPIFVIILFSFNDTDTGFGTAPRVKTQWQGFTTVWYQRLFDIPDLTSALEHSLLIALVSSVVAAAIGALLGLALARYRYRGKGATNMAIFLAISSPEVVLGAALASFFVSLGVPRGLGTLFLSHVMFSIPFVAVTVRARAANLDRALEDAAMDLGANQVVTFLKVTLPLIFPGILAGWLLAFALSMDDFVITQFVSGTQAMFPTWVFGATKVGIPPHVFVFATLIFLGGVLLAGFQALVSRRRPA
ncbi:MAG TPA: ABC transporter permease [Actinomycetota bacterium]|nr:ABC transporter permease [Actinomycetota bacterium]